MDFEKETALSIARADICQLLSIAFRFPETTFAKALVAGNFQSDLLDCVDELGLECADTLKQTWDIEFADYEQLLAEMKQEYSRLYLAPGNLTLIYPYESAFLAKEKDADAAVSLFITPIALSVEEYMKQAGVRAQQSKKEPADSVFLEFEFLSYLLATYAEHLRIRSNEIGLWMTRATAFYDEHIANWMDRFMIATRDNTESQVYKKCALTALELIPYLSSRNEN